MNISVILPVYNEEKTINQVISTLLEKVNDLLEVIVVNDGSTDSTGVICQEAQANNPIVHYILLPELKLKWSPKLQNLNAGYMKYPYPITEGRMKKVKRSGWQMVLWLYFIYLSTIF